MIHAFFVGCEAAVATAEAAGVIIVAGGFAGVCATRGARAVFPEISVASTPPAPACASSDGGGKLLTAGCFPVPCAAEGAPMRTLMNAGIARDVPAVGAEADDVDSWADLARLRGEEPTGDSTPSQT